MTQDVDDHHHLHHFIDDAFIIISALYTSHCVTLLAQVPTQKKEQTGLATNHPFTDHNQLIA